MRVRVQVKLLAEPWDCGGLYQVGSFPNWDVWGEWNGRFRDDVRRFIKGEPGCKPAFATRLAGSADLYHKNKRRVPAIPWTPGAGSPRHHAGLQPARCWSAWRVHQHRHQQRDHPAG